ncbi:unnamed protein product [Didymodactylos carnosus]|uniref:Uncharacterized protein n=1 Tax=Didymodactylos carnosus TaxID=1234261 RepID=A0A8S2UA17_9BILA|nr:unnamed protein product [Didymodactylos carnosus]CAF4332642.1 unnamed protein product [Didymodactylos carnosus]
MALKSYYQGNEEQLRVVNEFETTYRADQAIQWFTRNTFLYRLLNKALRQHNIELMFLFDFYVRDLYQQIKQRYEQFKATRTEDPMIKVYRGQIMPLKEIDRISTYAGWLIINCMFSTSRNRFFALFMLSPPSSSKPDDEVQYALFEIDVDIRKTSIPFADISDLSAFPEEEETTEHTSTS